MDEPHNQTYTNTPSMHGNSTDWDNNLSDDSDNYPYDQIFVSYKLLQILTLTFSFLGLCFTVFGLYSVVKSKTDNFVPVYVVNIFICDLIQTSSMLIQASFVMFSIWLHYIKVLIAMDIIYFISVGANISFMLCISAERYLMIAHPIWYKMNTNTIRKVFVSVTIWVISTLLTSVLYMISWDHRYLFGLLVFILPYPLLIMFFVGTWRGLSSNTTIPLPGQRRIMGTLALVLFTYTVSFLPFAIALYFIIRPPKIHFGILYFFINAAVIFMKLNPIFDFLLYLVMRKDAKDILSALCFCCRKRNAQNTATDAMREDQV